jgi:hypothetical protein
MIQLIPAQQAAYHVLRAALEAGSLSLLSSPAGRGRTTVLRKLHEETGGGFVTGKDFIETSAARHPLSLEETLYSAVTAALRGNDVVYVDDIDLIHDATSSCNFYPRGKYIETALLELSDAALREDKKLDRVDGRLDRPSLRDAILLGVDPALFGGGLRGSPGKPGR